MLFGSDKKSDDDSKLDLGTILIQILPILSYISNLFSNFFNLFSNYLGIEDNAETPAE